MKTPYRARPLRRRLPGAADGEFLITLLLVLAGVISFVSFVMPQSVAAAEMPRTVQIASGLVAPKTVTLNQVREGSLLFRGDRAGVYRQAPLVHTRLDMTVDGMIARATVTQRFHNPTRDWVEGVYAFPLPETAAVDGLRMRVGDRFIEGVVDRKAEARRTYETAKAAGKTAALVEQIRPNLFTNEVANIGPGEAVVVRLTFLQSARYVDGAFSLRFPTVSAPRYSPAAARLVTFDDEAAGSGWSASRRLLADAKALDFPVHDTAHHAINPFAAEVTLRPGFDLATVESTTHGIETVEDPRGATTVTLKRGPVAADRDFVLRWRPTVGEAPGAALFTQRGPTRPFGGTPIASDGDVDSYRMVMVMPPDTEATMSGRPRETVILIDVSGSMAGPSIIQARRAVGLALDRLRPGDRFNLIAFSNRVRTLFPAPRAAISTNLEAARRFVRGLEAGGGTEMFPALERALENTARGEHLRQIVFATDGAVANEDALFELIRDRLGAARLFTVGVGSAPNGHFMRRAARFGRGTFVQIDTTDTLASQMDGLFAKIESPVVTDLTVSFGAHDVAVEPAPIPDLYRGEPVMVTARVPAAAAEAPVVVSGRRGLKPWTVTLSGRGGDAQGVSTLWARQRIARLEDSRMDGADPERVKDDVTVIALEHGLLTRYTSLVAVDRTPRRPKGTALAKRELAVNLPAGWDSRFFQTADHRPVPSWEQGPSGDAPKAPGLGTGQRDASLRAAPPVALPQGATSALVNLVGGTVALLIAGLMAAFGWWRP